MEECHLMTGEIKAMFCLSRKICGIQCDLSTCRFYKARRFDVPSLTIVNDNTSLTIVKDDPSLTIVNDDPSLMIVNKERRREEAALKGIGTYH